MKIRKIKYIEIDQFEMNTFASMYIFSYKMKITSPHQK